MTLPSSSPLALEPKRITLDGFIKSRMQLFISFNIITNPHFIFDFSILSIFDFFLLSIINYQLSIINCQLSIVIHVSLNLQD